MGRDKASLPFGPETLIGRVLRTIRPEVSDIVIAAPAGSAIEEGARVVPDEVAGEGPLAALANVLETVSSDWARATVLVVAVDLPLLDQRLKGPFRGDANDHLYQWDSSRDYNPSPQLERIQAALLVINSADDERNPPELGVMERELKRVKNARLHLIPTSADTRGHGTTGMAKFWKREVGELLQAAPRRGR